MATIANTIETKYIPASNTKGSRIKAICDTGETITIGYPYELSGIECHKKAANDLAIKLGITIDPDYKIVSTKKGYIFIW